MNVNQSKCVEVSIEYDMTTEDVGVCRDYIAENIGTDFVTKRCGPDGNGTGKGLYIALVYLED